MYLRSMLHRRLFIYLTETETIVYDIKYSIVQELKRLFCTIRSLLRKHVRRAAEGSS